MISKADFPTLVTKIEEVYNEAASTSIADMVGSQVFDESQTDMFVYHTLINHALPGMVEVADGQQYPKATAVEGDSISYTQRHFARNISVTKTLRKFDRYDQIEDLVRSSTDTSFSTIDQSYADVLLYGWSSSYTDVWGKSVTSTGPDAVVLFSASHSNNLNSNTYTNRITDSSSTANPSVSYDAIATARRLARIHKDPQGSTRPIRLDSILIPPALEDAVNRIVYSNLLPGKMDNDINFLKGKFNPIVWEKLETRSDATDTSAYWFMFDSSKVKKSLVAKYAQKPLMTPPTVVHDTENWDWTLDCYYALGLGFPAYIWGSTGANA